jgi:hypothetical protein
LLQFLQPLWLWAAAGIIIPVLIHLWKVNEGKLLKVGSLSLLTASTGKSARTIQLNQLLLLLLRCLLILLIAFFLAWPQWLQSGGSNEEKGWILINQKNGNNAYDQYRTLIDSLEAAGFRFKSWDTSLSTIKKDVALNAVLDNGNRNNVSLWDMISVLNNKLPDTLPVYIFSPASLSQLYGSRPYTHLPVSIFEYDEKLPASTAILHAHLVNDDSVMLSIGTSTSNGNTIEKSIRGIETPSDGPLRLFRRDNSLYAAIGDSGLVEVDQQVYTITIVSEKGLYDAKALSAAFNAIVRYSGYRFQIQLKQPSDKIIDQQDWVFWLSEEPIPKDIKADHLFVYADGKHKKSPSAIIVDNENLASHPLPLFQRIEYIDQGDRKANAIWKDAFGEPILSVDTDKPTKYTFYSRFNAEWNGLVWDPVFPSLIFDLVVGKKYKSFPVSADQREINAAQLMPRKTTALAVQDRSARALSLSPYCWWLLLLVFIVERILSTVKKGKQID